VRREGLPQIRKPLEKKKLSQITIIEGDLQEKTGKDNRGMRGLKKSGGSGGGGAGVGGGGVWGKVKKKRKKE